MEPVVRPIEWLGDRIRIIDQRRLPHEEVYIDLNSADEVAAAIKNMAIRGAPLIGIAAAMGVAIEARRLLEAGKDAFRDGLGKAIEALGKTRPTARNLFWALGRISDRLKDILESGGSPEDCAEHIEREAMGIFEEDFEAGRRMGESGAELIKDGSTLLTHCNAGGLATSGYGTALAPMFVAHSMGKRFKVFADETRPLLQGARLTAWEFKKWGIDVTVICDSAAHGLLRKGMINAVFVGADRITRSGDFANKVGTFGLALSANASGVPFYVVAPKSTIDLTLGSGEEIPIEERDGDEVATIGGLRIIPDGVKVYNPAFDVTPRELVTGYITEDGLVSPPFSSDS